jgi:hypothetical protein
VELVLTSAALESSVSINLGIFQPAAGEYIVFLSGAGKRGTFKDV